MGIRRKDDMGNVFTHVAEVNDISGVGRNLTTEVFYTTDGDVFPAVMANGGDPGELTFDIQYVRAAGQVVLREASVSRSKLVFRLAFPIDPVEVWEFDGYVTKLEMQAPVEGVLRASVTVTLASHVAYSQEG